MSRRLPMAERRTPSMPAWVRWLALALWSTASCPNGRAYAQPRAPTASEELRLIEGTERDEDPLGIDESTGQGLDEAARAYRPPPAQEPAQPSPVVGEALTALAGVTESLHVVRVRFSQGLAFVSVHARFESRAAHAAELAYRLALPPRSVPTRLRACLGETCTEAMPQADEAQDRYLRQLSATPRQGSAPVLWAKPIVDARGSALSLRAAPIRERALDVYVEYVCEASVRGGRARLVLPARGYDPRISPASMTVQSDYGGELFPGMELSTDGFRPVELVAQLPLGPRVVRGRASAPCGSRRCTRSFRAAPPAPLSARPVWLALDASPSMEGPARGRASAAAAALLSALPTQTPVRAYAFAGRAVELGEFQAGQAPLAPLTDALLRSDLGSATLPSALLQAFEATPHRGRPRIVVLSDGLLDPSPREQRALGALVRHGAELWLLALGDEPPRRTDSFAGVLHVPTLADAVLRGDDLEPLVEALRAVASPLHETGLRAGEQRVVEQTPPHPAPFAIPGSWLPLFLARHRQLPEWTSGLDLRAGAPVPAIAFDPAPAKAPELHTGMPKESVLNMLRTQLVPQARACLRSDRKGRGDYAVTLTFHASFARREVSDYAVEGDIPEPLRACLERLLPALRVPAFSGRLRVRYPIHTEREASPPTIELEPEVEAQLERVIRGRGARKAAASP